MNPITLERAGLPYGVADAGDIPALGRPVARDVESLRVERLAAPAAASASGTGVALTPPSAASQQRLEVANRAEIASLVQAVGEDVGLARQVVLAGASTLLSAGLMSPQAFEIELAKITGEVENQQKKLKLTEIEQARKQNLQKMEDNQQKIRESEEAAKEAQKSGLAAKIFGWISAIASIIVGAIMVATGVGAAAGALMIAGGVMGVVSQSVQQAAADGLISKEVMEKLGPALMGIEIAVALLAAVVSFGGSAVGGLARLGAKIGGKAAEMTASLASKVADLGGKFGSLAGQSLSHSLKLGVQVSDLTLDVANGAAQATHSGFQAKAANRQADVQESRADLTTLQGQVVLEHARQAHVHGVVVAAAFGRAVQGEVLDRRHDAVRGGQVGALVGTDHHAGQQRGQVGVFAEAFRDPPPARVAGDVDHRREAHVEPVGAGFEGGDPRAAGDHLGVPAGGQAEADGKDGAVPVGHVVGMEQRDLQAAMADLVLHGANVRAGHGIEYGADLAGADIRHQRFLGMVGADADQA